MQERKKAKKLDEKLWHIDRVLSKQAAEQSVPKKSDQRVEQRPCFIEGGAAHHNTDTRHTFTPVS